MKKIVYAVMVVALLVIIGVIYSGNDNQIPRGDNLPKNNIDNQPSYEVETFATSTDLVNVGVKYPKFNVGTFSTEVTATVNSMIEHYAVDPAIEFFSTGAIEAAEIKASFPAWPGHYEFSTDFTIGTTTNDYINIIFGKYTDTGGAHGIGVTDVLVLGRADGDVITLEDLFVNATSAAEILPSLVAAPLIGAKMAKLSISETEAKADVEGQLDMGLAGIPQNFSEFSLAPGGITFIFGAYQVGAYVEGEYEVFVPWSDLQLYLAEDFKVMPN